MGGFSFVLPKLHVTKLYSHKSWHSALFFLVKLCKCLQIYTQHRVWAEFVASEIVVSNKTFTSINPRCIFIVVAWYFEVELEWIIRFVFWTMFMWDKNCWSSSAGCGLLIVVSSLIHHSAPDNQVRGKRGSVPGLNHGCQTRNNSFFSWNLWM